MITIHNDNIDKIIILIITAQLNDYIICNMKHHNILKKEKKIIKEPQH